MTCMPRTGSGQYQDLCLYICIFLTPLPLGDAAVHLNQTRIKDMNLEQFL